MRFMLIRKADADSEAGLMPDEKLIAAMTAYNEALVKAGVMRAGEGLHPSSRGARIHFTDGQPAVTDGPFAETKELVAGFTMIEVGSRGDAIEWARRWPVEDAGSHASIEIRETGCAVRLPSVNAAQENHGTGLLKRFMVMVHADAHTEAAVNPGAERLAAMQRANEDSARAGLLVAADGLQPSREGARVRFSGGKPSVIDGPFTEAKELIAGFWMIQVPTQADAIAWALRYPYPFRDKAVVEVRKVYEAADFGEAFTPALQAAEKRMRAHLLQAGRPLGTEP